MSDKSGDKHIGRYLDLGFQFAISILVGIGGGYWVDSKFDTSPLFLIVGLLFGGTAGFMSLYRTVYPPKSQNKKGNGQP